MFATDDTAGVDDACRTESNSTRPNIALALSSLISPTVNRQKQFRIIDQTVFGIAPGELSAFRQNDGYAIATFLH